MDKVAAATVPPFGNGKKSQKPTKHIDDSKKLPPLQAIKKLPKLLEEKYEEEAKKERIGPKPEAPKQVPRPLNDKRAVIIGELMDRTLAAEVVQNFQPGEWPLNDLWLNPDNRAEIQPDKLVVLFGKRRTGKSFATRWLLHSGRMLFNYGLVLANTTFNQFWQKHFPSSFVQVFDPVILDTLLAKQEGEMQSWIKAGRPRSHNPYKVVVLDDVVGSNFRFVDVINTFATRGRHYGICVFLVTQYPRLVSVPMRVNTDFAFIFFQQNLQEKTAIAEEYLGTMPLDHAMDLVARFTDVPEGQVQRKVLVLNQMENTRDLSRKIFLCEPKDPGEFVVGCPDFWKNDDNFQRWVRKGAFTAWKTYDTYLKNGKQDGLQQV